MAAPCQCLTSGGDDHRIAGGEGLRGLAPHPDTSRGPAVHSRICPAALGRMVDVPVVAAARLEGDVGGRDAVFTAEGLEVAVPHEILGVGVVGGAQAEDAAVRLFGLLVGPDFLCHAEGGPCLGPAGNRRRRG